MHGMQTFKTSSLLSAQQLWAPLWLLRTATLRTVPDNWMCESLTAEPYVLHHRIICSTSDREAHLTPPADAICARDNVRFPLLVQALHTSLRRLPLIPGIGSMGHRRSHRRTSGRTSKLRTFTSSASCWALPGCLLPLLVHPPTPYASVS